MVRLLLVLTVLLSLALCTTPACGIVDPSKKADPVVETLAATNIGIASATLNGRLTDMGDCKTVEVWFVYWRVDNLNAFAIIEKQTMTAIGDFSAQTKALTIGGDYGFRAHVRGEGQSGDRAGNVLSFSVPLQQTL